MRDLRFYEKNPAVHRAIDLLLTFPGDIRSILSRGFCRIAELEFKAHELIKDLKSLGKEKTLALYQSQKKRREYDHDPYLYKAMNYLMILSPEDQYFLSTKLMQLIQITRDFLALCKQHAVPLQLVLVEDLTNAFVNFGAEESKALLNRIESAFKHIAQNGGIPISQEPGQEGQPASETVSSHNSDMVLRLDQGFS